MLVLVGFVFVTCVKEVVTYCPFCGSSNIKEVSEYDTGTGYTLIHYECQKSGCEKIFGAGQIPN